MRYCVSVFTLQKRLRSKRHRMVADYGLLRARVTGIKRK